MTMLKNKLTKKIGGEEMKKALRSNKGFSLIELLIVIAIMGVLAIVAFSAFSGVLGNSKKKADVSQAKNIEKALQIYITDSGDAGLAGMLHSDGTTSWGITSGTTTWGTIAVALQDIVVCKDQSGNNKSYGPLLTNPNGGTTNVTASSYAPQWDSKAGGKHIGYKIDVYKSTSTVKVEPTETTGADKVNIIN